jgi:tryptophan 2,3-dioxygenase
MLFIILQQSQELWFKQILHEVHAVVDLLERDELLEATRLMQRVNRIMRVLIEELDVMEMLAPAEFMQFRHLLTPASGFESEQFRELELASGLTDETFLKLAEQALDLGTFATRWPKTFRDAFLEVLTQLRPDSVDALVDIYTAPARHPQLYALCEAVSEYEVRFSAWRFHHIKVVERVIGEHSRGTGGSTGVRYLARTLKYRFFPELWEARDRIAEGSL